MKKGCLIFAHDGKLDYGSQAVLSAKLANKYLKVPVSLVSDLETITNIHKNFSSLPFDQIIEIDKPQTDNLRVLNGENVEFTNGNRYSAYELTPYDRTLLIDSDFLIFSNELGKYWNSNYEFLITPSMFEPQYDQQEYVSDESIRMLWATNIMFSKTDNTKILFDLVSYIKEEYEYFSHLYNFDHSQFRNDFTFSIACHILGGYGKNPWHGELPIPVFYRDTSEIIKVTDKGEIVFLLNSRRPSFWAKGEGLLLSKSQGQDVHIMNKRSLLSNLDKLLVLADE